MRKNIQERLLLKDFQNVQLRCSGTWFIGLSFVTNNMLGGLDKVAFEGESFQAITRRYEAMFQTWDQAQIAICYEGTPNQCLWRRLMR